MRNDLEITLEVSVGETFTLSFNRECKCYSLSENVLVNLAADEESVQITVTKEGYYEVIVKSKHREEIIYVHANLVVANHLNGKVSAPEEIFA